MTLSDQIQVAEEIQGLSNTLRDSLASAREFWLKAGMQVKALNCEQVVDETIDRLLIYLENLKKVRKA